MLSPFAFTIIVDASVFLLLLAHGERVERGMCGGKIHTSTSRESFKCEAGAVANPRPSALPQDRQSWNLASYPCVPYYRKCFRL